MCINQKKKSYLLLYVIFLLIDFVLSSILPSLALKATHFISWNWVVLDLSEIAYLKMGCSVTLLLAMLDLTIKKCVPCNLKDLQPMSEEAANVLIPQVGV